MKSPSRSRIEKHLKVVYSTPFLPPSLSSFFYLPLSHTAGVLSSTLGSGESPSPAGEAPRSSTAARTSPTPLPLPPQPLKLLTCLCLSYPFLLRSV